MTRAMQFAVAVFAAATAASPATAATYIEPPYFARQVAAGELPPLAERLPRQPAVARFDRGGEDDNPRPGKYGGTLRMLMGKSKDIRMMMVYGYARLLGYDRDLNLRADLLAGYEVKEQRQFTFYLREGHRWSDGAPFTAEAFRYYWNDIVNNRELYPFGLPRQLLVDGEPPRGGVSRRDHGALHLVKTQSVFSAGAGRAAPAVFIRAGALPEAIPRRARAARRTRRKSERSRRAQLGRPAPPQKPPV